MVRRNPTLTLAYLPHLDYDLQRFGPDDEHQAVRRSLADIDTVAGDLAERARRRPIGGGDLRIRHNACQSSIHINRALR